MADPKQKWKENVDGTWFVDETCIACVACALTAPDNFQMNEQEGHAFVGKQPSSKEEETLCQEAMDSCPVEAIGKQK